MIINGYLLFNAAKVLFVTTGNLSPNSTHPPVSGSGLLLSVNFISQTPSPAIPPEFVCSIFKNGVLEASFTFTEVPGLNDFSGFATFDFTVDDNISASISHTINALEPVDWIDVNVSLQYEYEEQEVSSACPLTGSCEGFSREQLLELWTSSVDTAYSRRMLELGEGKGSLEHITQAFEQLSKVSCAIDRTVQAMFIMPFSGQTGEPAAQERKACVELQFNRTKLFQYPLVIDGVKVIQSVDDAGSIGPVTRFPGRRYELDGFVAFVPGMASTQTIRAFSEKPGYGYNYPLPGSLNIIEQKGKDFSNIEAGIIYDGDCWLLQGSNDPDVFIPEHIGQYVEISSPLNGSLLYRIRGYIPPDLTLFPPSGGCAVLDVMIAIECPASGIYTVGEYVIQNTTNARGILRGVLPLASGMVRVLISVTGGTFALGAVPDFNIICQSSSAQFYPDPGLNPNVAITFDNTPQPEPVGNVSWAIVPWERLGLTVTNAKQPTGGRLGFLDALGRERGIDRSPGEPDEIYRKRVHELANTVSPNAIKRAINRVLAPYGLTGCLREVGQLNNPGFYFDAPDPYSFFYDYDTATLNGLLTTSSFIENEPVMVNNTPDLLPLGTYGLARGLYSGTALGKYFFTRKGLNPWKDFGGKYVIGLISGAILEIAAVVYPGVRPENRFKTYYDYVDFRAFFLVGVPSPNMGDYGFFYDAGVIPFFDSAPFLTFFDGSPVLSQILNLSIFNDIYNKKAGGVGFALYREDIGCVP